MNQMAIDTVTLRSPFITEEVAQRIELQSIKRQGVNMKSGELLYSLTTARLKGSFDARISVKVERQQKGFDNKIPYKKDCSPFITLECSVHKALIGHNVYGGTDDFRASILWLIDKVNELLGVQLPPAPLWQVRRIDVAEVFMLVSEQAVQEWFQGLKINDTFRRRSVSKYGQHGLLVVGTTTSLKFYHKGKEFAKHDARRLLPFTDVIKVAELQELADRLLRAEVEIKTRKLKEDFGHVPLVSEITINYLNNLFDKEVGAFLKEGASRVGKVITVNAVRQRLVKEYGERRAKTLFNTWHQLATLGEQFVKDNQKPATFYEHVKLIRKAECSWHSTDLLLRRTDGLVPEGFSPTRCDKRRLTGELPVVQEKLKLYRERSCSENVLLNEENSNEPLVG